MEKANPAQVLAGFLFKEENQLPKNVMSGSIERGFEVDNTKLLPYLMKFQYWLYDNQPKESPTTADASVLKEALEKIIALPGEWNEAKQLARKALADFLYPGMNNEVKAQYSTQSPSSIEESGLKEGEDKFWDDFAIEYEALQRMEENTWEWNRSILKEKYRISKI